MKKTTTILAAMLMVINITKAQWVYLGGLTNTLQNHIIYSVITDRSGNVYAAGASYNVITRGTDTTAQYFVAKWTDTAWTELGAGSHALKANGYIYSLASDTAGNIYAAGAFTDDTSSPTSGHLYVAKWVDTAWTELGAGVIAANPSGSTAILSITLDPAGNVYAAGDFTDGSGRAYVAKWNGSTWSELGTGSAALNANAYIHTVVSDPSGNIYAAGLFTDTAGYQYVAEWSGSAWGEMGTGSNALTATSLIHAVTSDPSGNIYVAYPDTQANYFVARWNGSGWAQVGTGSAALNANGSINALTTDLSGNLYAAGNFTDANTEQYVAMWNGTNWTELGAGIDALDPSSYILTIAVDNDSNVYAAGNFTNTANAYVVAEYDPNTQVSGISAINPTTASMSIAPNPTTGHADITLSEPTEVNVSVAIYDMAGRQISIVYASVLKEGEINVVFDASGLESGIYLAKMTDGKSFIQKRFVKL